MPMVAKQQEARAGSWENPSLTTNKKTEKTGIGARLWPFKAATQWHTFSRQVDHLKVPQPPQIVLLTGNQLFKYLNLWGTFCQLDNYRIWGCTGPSSFMEKRIKEGKTLTFGDINYFLYVDHGPKQANFRLFAVNHSMLYDLNLKWNFCN